MSSDYRISIRWVTEPTGTCARCGEVVGRGPIGYQEGEEPGPVCDRCLIDAEPGLGMLLVAGNLMREVAQDAAAERADLNQVLLLLVFAKLYDQAEGEHWPARPIAWRAWLEELDGPGDPGDRPDGSVVN